MISYDMNRLLAAARTTTPTTDVFSPVTPPIDGTRQPAGKDVFVKDTTIPTTAIDAIRTETAAQEAAATAAAAAGQNNMLLFGLVGIVSLYFLAKK
jgi:hypothetical protein